MLLVVDRNPRLERRFSAPSFPKGRETFAESLDILASGVGVDLTNVGVILNEDMSLMCFLGGVNGELFAQKFLKTRTRLLVERLKDETQELVLLEEAYKRTRIYTKEPRITRDDVNRFYQLFKNELDSHKAVVLSPNSREDNPSDMDLAMVKLARGASVPIILPYENTEDFKERIEARPFGVVLTKKDLEARQGKKLQFIGEIIEEVKKIFQDKVPLVLLTGSKKGVVLYTGNKVYFAHLERGQDLDIDPNRAMVGLASGIARKYEVEMILQLAVATGNNKREFQDFASIKAEMNRLKIETMEV